MNRHERRKAKALRIELVELSPHDARTMLEGGSMCAWEGCTATYMGEQPEGWRWLLVYGAPRPVLNVMNIPGRAWDRDGTLCPAHARQLDTLLKDIGGQLRGPVAGQA